MEILRKTAPHYPLLFLVGLMLTLASCSRQDLNREQDTEEEKEIKKEPVYEFGIAVDSLGIEKSVIKKNEFMGALLAPFNINPQKLAALAAKSKDIFDIRKLQVGKPYTILYSKDSVKEAKYFIYQPSRIDYVVYDLSDSLDIYEDRFPTKTVEREESGIIESSLTQSLAHIEMGNELAAKMAKIYAWDIDFYKIQKGDYFKLIYEVRYLDDEPVDLGRIKTIYFNHKDEDFYAFYYKNDSTETEDYFDENAKSLRKAFLKAPLKYFRITSRYSGRRFHPVQHRYKAHLGTDYAAPTGTPIMATAAGTVVASAYTQFNGNYVKIRHNGTYTTQYLHMNKRAVRVGQHVKQGQTIGYVGSTGLATGPHVCYRFWKNGQQINPYSEKFPSAEPIQNADRSSFDSLVAEGMRALSAIPVDTTASSI